MIKLVYLANVELGHQIKDTEEVRKYFWTNFSKYFTESADYLGWSHTITRTIDCANGIGAKAMPEFSNLISKYITAHLANNNEDEYLNK